MTLVVKRIFAMPLRGLQKFINFVIKLIQLPLSYHHYSYISKRAKTINVTCQTKTKRTIPHLAISSTRLKIYGDG
ncbi:Mobile element protein [Candidatus Enterovibrio altilux]|uniref:Mobile element protein n=1 Tax=Candidatus Enterovibrio altilux TaxID=1927128 RepID=A0A291B7Z8_9GAMM|nr:Mobile element protein [Candidatus Enterovibrio luxaltus]